jgi:tetratricopeptide (TPR) repeat protein
MLIVCSGVMPIATHDMSIKEQETYKKLSREVSHHFLSKQWKNIFQHLPKNNVASVDSKTDIKQSDIYAYLQTCDSKPAEKIINDMQKVADYIDQLGALFNKDRRIDKSNIEQFHAIIDNALSVNEDLEIFNAGLLGIKFLLDGQLHSYTEAIDSINDILARFEAFDIDDKNSVFSNCKALVYAARGSCYKLLGDEEKAAEDMNTSQQYAGCTDVKVICLGSHIVSLIS